MTNKEALVQAIVQLTLDGVEDDGVNLPDILDVLAAIGVAGASESYFFSLSSEEQ